MTKYYALKENGQKNNYLRADLFYDLGGYSYFTGNANARGYYISVRPVSKGDRMESYTLFDGIKKLVKEVTRQSKKAEQEAENMFPDEVQQLIDYVCKQHGYELADENI